jgi:hypothetical protein
VEVEVLPPPPARFNEVLNRVFPGLDGFRVDRFGFLTFDFLA